ncbi:MAG: glucose/galactose MFS transporter [Alteromonadaceae bacterium]|nr:MAG: glucose/galactose MFS transporter [Alteromonadaceae bacterium]
MAGAMEIDSGYISDRTGAQSYIAPLAILTTLFFAWGVITSLNEILVHHLRDVFSLSYFQAMAVHTAFFGAYAIVSYPAGILVKKIGYQRGIVIGLTITALGCIGFYPAAEFLNYSMFLGALFILASGITILQVSANPYVTALGKPKTASSRLSMTQAFNSFGTVIGPLIGGSFILSAAVVSLESATALQKASAVQSPYLVLAVCLAALAVVMAFVKLPQLESQVAEAVGANNDSAWRHSHLILGAIGIFVYVGAEVGIATMIIGFLHEPHIAGLAKADAANYVSYYFGGAMIGRFLGAYLMLKIPAKRVLTVNAFASIFLLILAMTFDGAIAMWAVIAIGLFNSIMFPVIFSLGVEKLGPVTGQGSGILCIAIAGGAIIPPLQGALSDSIGIQLAFALPVICYLYIAFYGLVGSKIKTRSS